MEIIVNISALKEDNEGVSINAVKSDLVEFGAIVRGAKDVDGDTLMLINGDITVEDVENAFINIGVNVNDYIVEEDDLTIEQTFEKKNVAVKKNQTAVNEKKGSCCPPKKANGENKVKKEYKGDLVNLSEALHGTHKRGVKPELKLNQIIDAIDGCHIDESISARAIEKAKQNNKRAYLQEKLGAEVYNAVLESLENGTTVHANKKINGKAVCEYSIDELKGLMEKASKQIEALEKKLGLNEADDAELTKKIAHFKDAVKMIDEEISFREAKELLSEGDGIEFKNINPNVSDDDKKKEEKKDEEATVEGDGSDEVSDEDDAESKDDTESEDDADDKDEQNPDEDEEVELASIIITLATKDDAEDLKADFIEAGIPEDAIELEEVADDDDEDGETEDGESEGESTEETDTENASEETEGGETTEESVQFKGVKPLNEDDEDNADDAETTEDDSTEDDETEDDEESEDEEAEKAWKVILVNTDYAKEAKDVLVDMWGMTEEEFNDMIGGDIVDDEDNAEDDGSDESSDNDDDSTKSDDENGESEDDDDDFDPNDIFANF